MARFRTPGGPARCDSQASLCADLGSPALARSRRVALMVLVVNGEMTLCPFFAKCDGVLVIDPDAGTCEFLAKTHRTPEAMCDLVLVSGARRLVSGFVPNAAARRLRAASIDIRLGSIACPVEELAAGFDRLPRA